MSRNEESVKFIVSAKEQYRKAERSLSWEEKVAAIERMRDAAAKARSAMRQALQSSATRR